MAAQENLVETERSENPHKTVNEKRKLRQEDKKESRE